MMLVRAELSKLVRQRGAFFWGFVALPCFLILLACVLNGAVPPGAGAAVEIRPVRTLLRAVGAAGNPFVQLFLAIGAASLFALEYRHASWRLLVPRHSRAALLAAKLAAFAIAAAGSLILLSLGNLFAIYVPALLRGAHPIASEALGAGVVAITLTLLVSMLQLLGLAAWVALMAVITRSTMGAILPPFLLAFASSAIQAYIGGEPGSILALPGAAPDLLRAGIAFGFDGARNVTTAQALAALAITAAWFVVPMAAAVTLFSRQDLASA
jgi:hypothetical protein